jgi:preprotein translocase subunit SecD
VRLALVVLVLFLAGCSAEVTGAPAKDDSPKVGHTSLVVPIELRPVLETGAGKVLKDPATGESLTLADPMMTIEELDGAEIIFDKTNGTWALTLNLNDADTKKFGDWTTEHTNERLAVVIDDAVVIAPTIQSPITGGEVQITGNYTQDEVKALLDKVTGR